jgi:hypothetical protein
LTPRIIPPRFIDESKAHDSWLSDFFTTLQDGIIEAKNLDKIFSNLTIINFNYDRCLEHYLFHVMQRLYPSKGETYVADLINATLKVHHPYGVIGNLPWQSRTNAVQFGGASDGDDIGSLSSQIRTYNEEVDDTKKIEEIRAAMAEAKQIVFLGFHFHKQNVELLSPDADKPGAMGTVVVYGTQVNRSLADIEIIKSRRIPRILHGRSVLPSSSYTIPCGCKAFFENFGGVLSG